MKSLQTRHFIGVAFLLIALGMSFACTGNSGVKNADTSDSDSVVKDDLPHNLTQLYKDDAFARFLRTLPRKKRSAIVKLFDGSDAEMEGYKYCVVDFPLLSNIEQCADVCMHLRAEYLFEKGQYDQIHFQDVNGRNHPYTGGNSKANLERYLREIYSVANTSSLSHEMTPVGSLSDMRPGDMFVISASQGGLGHTVMVMDVAKDESGNIWFQVGQGFTPACDFHIVKNVIGDFVTPWYKLDPTAEIVILRCFEFQASQLKRWE